MSRIRHSRSVLPFANESAGSSPGVVRRLDFEINHRSSRYLTKHPWRTLPAAKDSGTKTIRLSRQWQIRVMCPVCTEQYNFNYSPCAFQRLLAEPFHCPRCGELMDVSRIGANYK
jgi:predicted RNA-binding Zn-ribbon protein involved in translation (DUF1610 family)